MLKLMHSCYSNQELCCSIAQIVKDLLMLQPIIVCRIQELEVRTLCNSQLFELKQIARFRTAIGNSILLFLNLNNILSFNDSHYEIPRLVGHILTIMKNISIPQKKVLLKVNHSEHLELVQSYIFTNELP